MVGGKKKAWPEESLAAQKWRKMDALQILELFAFEALWVKRIVSACWTPKYKLWYVQRELNYFILNHL